MLKVDLHTHTIASGHSTNTIYEMVQTARWKGMELLGLTDHGPAVNGAPLDSYFRHQLKLSRRIFDQDFLLGCEANIMDVNGRMDINNRILNMQDIVLAGIHREAGWSITSPEENANAIIEVMKNPYVYFISHPVDTNYKTDVDKLVKASYEYQVPLEINCLHLSYYEQRKVDLKDIRQMIGLVKDYKWKLIVSSDAHVATQIGDDSIVDRLNLRELLSQDIILNSSAAEVKSFLEKKRKNKESSAAQTT